MTLSFPVVKSCPAKVPISADLLYADPEMPSPAWSPTTTLLLPVFLYAARYPIDIRRIPVVLFELACVPTAMTCPPVDCPFIPLYA